MSKETPRIPETIVAYTDGACTGNGKKNAKGGVGVFFEPFSDTDGRNIVSSMTIQEAVDYLIPGLDIGAPTNQKAELLAILKAINTFKSLKNSKNKILHIKTDSMYSINCLTKWYKNWIKNNWKNSKGNPVLNKEIIQKILEEMQTINVTFFHVKAHKTEPPKSSPSYKDWYGNDKADMLATQACKVCN